MLAQEADVSERTVQAVERGDPAPRRIRRSLMALDAAERHGVDAAERDRHAFTVTSGEDAVRVTVAVRRDALGQVDADALVASVLGQRSRLDG